jgi:alpha-L-arabinofuranosidase
VKFTIFIFFCSFLFLLNSFIYCYILSIFRFFKEINHAGAGGLWAELVNNRGFEAEGEKVPSSLHPWKVIGGKSGIVVSIEQTSLFERNRNALRMDLHCDRRSSSCLPDGVGISNPGFWGMVR